MDSSFLMTDRYTTRNGLTILRKDERSKRKCQPKTDTE